MLYWRKDLLFGLSMDHDLILRLLAALESEGVQYVIVGGVALNLNGLPRATSDIDLFVNPTADNIRRLRAALNDVFEDPEIEQISADDLAGAYPAIQYVPPTGEFHVDILARLGERYRYEDIEGQDMDVEGIRVRVATPRMLYRMKRDSVRLRDRADAERLLQRFGWED